ncbi:MAG: hypothetical protein ABEJ56_04425 [Candidatus Nanohaloarchaea archaeon]
MSMNSVSKLLKEKGPLTKEEIVEETGLSKSTVDKNMASLINYPDISYKIEDSQKIYYSEKGEKP